MPPAYRLLALDIDGTLVNSNHELTPRTAAALIEVRRAGLEVVLATGRRYSRALPLFKPLGLKLPIVTASGALIKDPADHGTLFRAEFEPAALLEMLGHLHTSGYEAVVYTDSFAEGFDFYCPRLEVTQPELLDFMQLNPGCGRAWPTLTHNPPADVFAGFAIGTRPDMLRLRDELAERWPNHLSVHVLRSPRYLGFMCEIAPVGISKWSGIQQLAHAHGIPDEAICAVGDDVNDLPMIREAGLGVAMANALDEVKAAADRIAPSNDEDGVAEVVRWLLE